VFKKLFQRAKEVKEEILVAPISGKVIPIEEVPDPTFSQKMMGDGIAIVPSEGKVVSPIDGEIINFFRSKHAIGILSETGLEVLIHIGLETVLLNGEGFTGHVQIGDKVKKGDLLISFDLPFIEAKAASTVTPIVITNSEVVESLNKTFNDHAIAGQSEILRIKTKN
jgi:sugar PTS system EIIA component